MEALLPLLDPQRPAVCCKAMLAVSSLARGYQPGADAARSLGAIRTLAQIAAAGPDDPRVNRCAAPPRPSSPSA